MSLRQRLLLAFLFVVIIPITLLGMIIIELIMTRSDESIANTVEHELTMAQAQYQQQGETIKQGIMQAAGVLYINKIIASDNQAALQQTLQAWGQVHPQVDAWLITDDQGYIITQFDPTNSYDPAITPFGSLLDKVLTTSRPWISTELLDDPRLERQHMVRLILVPFGPEDDPEGAIMAIDRLDNNVHPVPPQDGLPYGNETKDTSLLSPLILITQQDNIISTSPTDLTGEQILTPEIQDVIQLTVSTNWGYRGRNDIATTPYQLAGDPIFDSNKQIIGGFFIGLPYRKYFGLQAQTGWIVTGMLIFSGVISFIIASLIASAITQPIQNLIEKSGQLAGGDLSIRASVSGNDEIAQLGHAFNKMAAQLETSYEEVTQERGRALAIIEASADGIWVTNKRADGTRGITIANSALEYMTGRNRVELVGQQCSGLLGICAPNKQPICSTICPLDHPDKKTGMVHGVLAASSGDTIPVEISYGRLTNRHGELTGLVHIMRDLTLRREVEKLKADFISMVSHELRTPLSHIKGFADTLLQPDVDWDVETQHDFLSSIDREVDRLTKLVENLLQMSRIEAGGLKTLERRLYHVDEFVELTLPELRRRVNGHNLIINTSPASAATPVLIDIRGLELVLLNLVENAAKYSPSRTEITLRIERDDKQVVFHVKDEGAGISPDDQPHIFDRFYRAKAIQHGTSGTGLGLAICKRMVEAHSGRIWVTSNIGKGACFSFSLPVEIVREEAYV